MGIINKYIDELKKWDGYLEKASNSQLDNKTANAGSKNYTRFGRDYTKYVGQNFQAVPWCMIYLNAILADIVGLANAKKALYGSLYASCTMMVNAFKAKKAFHTTPSVGDFVIFTHTKTNKIAHVGLVTEIKNGKIYTIEGNTSAVVGVVENGGMVRQKSYAVGYRHIYGYCRPNYKVLESSIKDGWVQIGNKWQHWKNNIMQKATWVKSSDNKDWYYVKVDGWMAEKEWIQDKGKWYYLKDGGKMAINESLKIGNETFYFLEDGRMGETNSRGALL